MKSIFKYGLLLLYCIFLLSFISLNEVVSAIKSGNASELSKYFDNTVEISLANKTSTYSKRQAELVVRDFFKNNIVKDFSVLLKGNGAGTQFVSGALFTTNGTYQTTFFLKQKGDQQVLQEIRFEK